MPPVAWCAAAPAVAHVLVDALDDELVLAGGAGHHLERVRRLRPGEPVTAADGAGAWRLYRVARVARGRLVLAAAAGPAREPSLRPGLRIACALTKGARPESVVRHATELGVDAVLPVVAVRSVARWPPDRERAAVERLRRVAEEAAGQCRRARRLVVEPLQPLDGLAGDPGLVLADREGSPAGALPEPGPSGWLVVVGPEGGLEPGERQALDDPPRLAVGPHVLRAETAAVAAAAALAGRRVPAPPTTERDARADF
ncbi:MAG TPA: RsmE family RNA methyltransferase [Acidimicrobiia bacterium]|nr:RsmE family RNA methyltransferase [Acidimicrobiia bacterium]